MQIRINVKGASRRKAAVVQQVREYPDGPMTVEEFLAETVRQNVRDYNERKEAGEILRLFSADVLEEKAQILGGLILIAIGVKILLEHSGILG